MTQPIDVCAAVILQKGRLLLATRRPGSHLAGKWEFPGGKKEDRETLADCIRRELREELALDIIRAFPLFHILHVYPEKTIRLHFLACIPHENSSFSPKEGQKADWFSARELEQLDMAPADARIVQWLRHYPSLLIPEITVVSEERTQLVARELFT